MAYCRWVSLVALLVACSLPSRLPMNAATPTTMIGGCPMFPDNNIWNTPIATLPVASQSAAYIRSIGPDASLKADFGSGLYDGGPIGIPFVAVDADQPRVPIVFDYADESDPGPYPIPPDAPIEGGTDADGDRHVLVIDTGACKLYEVYRGYRQKDGSWLAGSGAIFDLRSHQLRPTGWTSADAAGLPILPGLVRYDEVAAGEIRHALRFTVPKTQRAYVWPARHYASDDPNPALPPMGQRFRLRADVPIDGYSPQLQVILRALKTYGMILADNGSAWFVSGAPDGRWDNDLLRELGAIHGSDFEAVDTQGLIVDPDSGAVKGPSLMQSLWLPLLMH